MRKTPGILAIPLSFFSPRLYREAMEHWWGFGFSYLYLVVCLAFIPVCLHYSKVAESVTLDQPLDIKYILKQTPPMTLEKGVLVSDVRQPYYVQTKQTNRPIAILNTWEPPEPPGDRIFRGVVLGRDTILAVTPWHVFRWTYPPGMTLVFTANILTFLAETLVEYLWLLPWLFYPAAVAMAVFALATLVLLMAVFGVAGLIFAGYETSYTGMCRMLSISMTPMLVFFSLNTYFEWDLRWYWLVSVFAAYVIIGLWANMEDENFNEE